MLFLFLTLDSVFKNINFFAKNNSKLYINQWLKRIINKLQIEIFISKLQRKIFFWIILGESYINWKELVLNIIKSLFMKSILIKRFINFTPWFLFWINNKSIQIFQFIIILYMGFFKIKLVYFIRRNIKRFCYSYWIFIKIELII